MDLGLNGRNAVVCASSQGLGRACALEGTVKLAAGRVA
jgi:3-oxoacyl-[acyl-carrier protein] reductase